MYKDSKGEFLLAVPIKQLKDRHCGTVRVNVPEVLQCALEDRRLPITRRIGVKMAVGAIVFITVSEFQDTAIHDQLSKECVETFERFL